MRTLVMRDQYGRQRTEKIWRRGVNGWLDKVDTGDASTFGQNYFRRASGKEFPVNQGTKIHENIHLMARRIAQDSFFTFLFGRLDYDLGDRRLAWKISGYQDGM